MPRKSSADREITCRFESVEGDLQETREMVFDLWYELEAVKRQVQALTKPKSSRRGKRGGKRSGRRS
jgi:hypothetical protein